MKYTVTPAKLAIMRNATIMMAAILGVLRLCIDEVLADDTSDEDIECTEGVGSFLFELLILSFFFLSLFLFTLIGSTEHKHFLNG